MLLPKRYGLDIICLFALLGCISSATAESTPSFERDIAPLLTVRCLKCHSGATAKGDLDLTNRAALLAGGASGVVLAPGKSADSLLFERAR